MTTSPYTKKLVSKDHIIIEVEVSDSNYRVLNSSLFLLGADNAWHRVKITNMRTYAGTAECTGSVEEPGPLGFIDKGEDTCTWHHNSNLGERTHNFDPVIIKSSAEGQNTRPLVTRVIYSWPEYATPADESVVIDVIP